LIIAAIVLTLAALAYVLFVREKDIPEPIPVSPIQHLEDRKQAIYDNLRDLQFEYRLGKLSDEDYQQNKLALQRELAGVLADMDTVVKKLGLSPTKVETKKAEPRPASTKCPHCGAKFSQALKFCGECGKAIA
jgi:rRNA maturation endonuclease Nob1